MIGSFGKIIATNRYNIYTCTCIDEITDHDIESLENG